MDKERKIRKNSEYKRIFSRARWISGKWITIHYLTGEGKQSRWGIVVSKKIGGAVVRNRIRRQIREICRVLDPFLVRKLDLVIVARRGIQKINYWDLLKDAEQVCRKAKFIREGDQIANRKDTDIANTKEDAC